MPYEEIKGIVIAVLVLAVVGPFVGDFISRHSKHRKPEKPIQKGKIWESNNGSLPILTLAVRLVEKQEQEELEEEEALQRAIEAVLAQNKRDYRQDIKTGRIWICPKCKKKNERYVTTSTCGTPRPEKKIVKNSCTDEE